MVHILWLVLAALLGWLAFLVRAWLPYAAVGIIGVLWIIWILVSVLSPAVPKRTCPRCGEEGLVKIRRGEPGVRCEKCDYRDEDLHVAYLDEW